METASRAIERSDPSLRPEVYEGGYHHFVHKVYGVVGVDLEEGEFLYGLVRLIKPKTILELGTNVGISTRYLALALDENQGGGGLITVEWNQTVMDEARRGIAALGLDGHCTFQRCSVAQAVLPPSVDLLFLDTELATRYAEMQMLYSRVAVGGLILIHDMPRLGVPEFGPTPDWVVDYLTIGKLSVVTVPTTHGLTLFQKRG